MVVGSLITISEFLISVAFRPKSTSSTKKNETKNHQEHANQVIRTQIKWRTEQSHKEKKKTKIGPIQFVIGYYLFFFSRESMPLMSFKSIEKQDKIELDNEKHGCLFISLNKIHFTAI